jgi:hypothetical protein
MNKLEKNQLLFLKKNYFTANQKTLCKKMEQYGGTFNFEIDNQTFKISFEQSKAYTNFIFESKLLQLYLLYLPMKPYSINDVK